MVSATEAFLREAEATLRPTIHEALAAVARDVGAVAKNLKNADAGYAARSIDDVLNAIHGPLGAHGVNVVPQVLKARYEVVHVGRNQTPMRQATLKVRYTFYGPSGDSVSAVTWGEALDSGDKATSKAMSAALKVALLQTFTIPLVGEDADARSYERSTPPPVVDREKVRAVQERVKQLGPALADAFKTWKDDQGFPWPWPAAACDAMLAMLDEIGGGEPEAPQVGDGDDGLLDSGGDASTPVTASPPSDEDSERPF